jgi:hypothetical protein
MLSQKLFGLRWAGLVLGSCLAGAGCKSDLNQQLLERELRYQEDQIYQLQDELQDKCLRLDSLSGENTSLRRQLGVSDDTPVSRPRGGRPQPASAPVSVPPSLQIPEAIRGPAAGGGGLAPPALDNIPPLPVKPSSSSVPEPTPLSLPEPADAVAVPMAPSTPAADPSSLPVPVAYDQPLAEGRPVRLVINAAATACFDDNGDGSSDGVAVTFEPRDADEKLVPAEGSVSIALYDVAAAEAPIATWTIPSSQAATHFRRTTRLRGMHFPLRWTGVPPTGDHVRVVVSLTGPDGTSLETDATIPSR